MKEPWLVLSKGIADGLLADLEEGGDLVKQVLRRYLRLEYQEPRGLQRGIFRQWLELQESNEENYLAKQEKNRLAGSKTSPKKAKAVKENLKKANASKEANAEAYTSMFPSSEEVESAYDKGEIFPLILKLIGKKGDRDECKGWQSRLCDVQDGYGKDAKVIVCTAIANFIFKVRTGEPIRNRAALLTQCLENQKNLYGQHTDSEEPRF